MCGIVGIIKGDQTGDDLRDALNRMCATLRHRGPDDEGIFTAGDGGIAMRRLSIIDVAGGHQPFVAEDGSAALVFNGEIYNHLALRDELTGLGHKFHSRSDGEVILRGFLQWGEKICGRLDGMFAFAIYQPREKRLFLARDRFGEKPLYYALLPTGGLAFASEIKALLTLPELPRRMSAKAVYHYLTLQYVPDPLSGFEGIWKLPAAHFASWNAGDSEIAPRRYWQLEYEPKERIGETEAAAKIRDLTERSVKARLMSEVPLGVFLSGGIDSTIVAALMARNMTEPLKTFSIGFGERSFSELPHARNVAERYKTDHHEFLVTPDAAEILPKLVEAFDEPYADSSALPVWYLSELTRRHVTVALTGDGGDEMFAGYQRYDLDRFANAWLAISRFLRRPLERIFENVKEPMDIPIERNWRAGLKRLGQVARCDPRASVVRWGSYFSEPMKRGICSPDFLSQAGVTESDGENSEQWIARLFDSARAETFLDRTLSADIAGYLVGDLLVKADRMTMAHSLEARAPFLDHHLAEYSARLPANFKLKGRRTKHILKQAFADLIPPELLNRPKQGFGIPLGLWMREGKLADRCRASLESLSRRGLFKPNELTRLDKEHRSGQTDHGKRLWTLLMLEEWHQFHRL